MKKLWIVALVSSVIGVSACKKAERLAFDPETPIVIESDKGVPLPKVVGKTADGEVVEVKEAIAISVLPVGIVEVQGEKLLPTKNGKVKVTAQSGEIMGTLDVTVRIIDEVRVTCPVNPCVVAVGADVTLAGQVMGLGAGFDTELTWTSSADTIAKVEGGKVTGVAAGKATITVEAAGKKASVDVEVKPLLEELRLFCAAPPLYVSTKAGAAGAIKDRSCEAATKETLKLWTETIAGGQPMATELEWSSSDGSLTVVKGETVPDRVGGAVVTAKSGATSLEIPVSVTEKKRGAPTCDDTFAKWTTKLDVSLKASIGETPVEQAASLRCQSRDASDCAENAFKEMQTALPTFGVDAPTAQRLLTFFTDETARRCCCAKQ